MMNTQYEEADDFGNIAIVGMAGRFPGAKDLAEFWRNLRDGVETISFFSDEELLASGIERGVLERSNYVKAAGMLTDIEWFDADFFHITPREAEIIDPQHRIFLECAWEALEDAGYDAQRYDGRIGVFGGINMSAYLMKNLFSNPELLSHVDETTIKHGNDKDYVATRTSYKMNLKGPSLSVQAGCSTSLAAIYLAYQSLLSGESDMTLAGAVNLNNLQKEGYFYHEGSITSPDGHCRTFDAQAQGTLFTSGAGIVVMKRLQDARKDGDYIYAVIKGVAMNNDGAAKVGYTAPSIEGQSRVIADALQVANVAPESISYVEAHGTGTVLGDPIEITALTQAFREGTQDTGFCAIGSLKTNLGHLNVASGVAGVLKTALALKHGQIPPSLNFKTPNPAIDFEHSPFYVNTELVPWKQGPEPRRAGVSSFGMGGTNVHAILEEAPHDSGSSSSRSWQMLLLSARTVPALEMMTRNLGEHLANHPQLNLADVAYSLQLGRTEFPQRRMLLVRNIDEVGTVLQNKDQDKIFTRKNTVDEPSIAFLFPGQGTQNINIGLEMYRHEPFFRTQIDECATILQPLLGENIRELLYPEPDHATEAAARLTQTALAQPVLFVIEYAFARLWMEWGVRPQFMIGHSLGEYVAACLSEVFSLEDALKLVVERGRLMQQTESGNMLAIALSEEEVQAFLSDQLSLAAINGPQAVVVSGPTEAIAALQKQLASKSVISQLLRTNHAFHSWMMEPIQQAFMGVLNKITLNEPRVPYLSNVTGTWIMPEQATDPRYWVSHLRAPVRFSESLQTLLSENKPLLLEVGPGGALGSLARRLPEGRNIPAILSSTPRSNGDVSEWSYVLQTLGSLWLAGVSIDWKHFYAFEQRQRVPLPTYPFERQRYWVESRGSLNWGQNIDTSQVSEKKSKGPAVEFDRDQMGGSLHLRPELINQYVAAETVSQKRMVQIWQRLFGIAPVGISDNFFDLGGDSVLITQLAREIYAAFQIDLSVRLLFEATTIRALCQIIERIEENPETEIVSEVDFTREILLDPAIQSPAFNETSSSAITSPKSILLTGATGFLGAFLLQELWERTDAKIYTLVRASSPKDAESRLLEMLTYCRMFELVPAIGGRIHPIAGNLANPLLGFSQESFNSLAHEADAIYHCGAIVNFAYPYSSLRASNVEGTQEILRLASMGQRKMVHYISSTAVFSAPDYYNGDVISEEAPLAHVERLTTGYAQSKWVAEHLMEQAGERGIPMSIYRIGDIGADSRTGVWSTKEMLARTIKSCIQLGCASDAAFAVTLLPVDYVSKALVDLSLQAASSGQKFHFVGQQSVSWQQMLEWLQSYGYPLRILSYREWYMQLKEQSTPENALYPLIATLADGTEPAKVDVGEEAMRRFSTQNSDKALQQSGIILPPYDEQYFEKMLTFFRQAGFFPDPQGEIALK